MQTRNVLARALATVGLAATIPFSAFALPAQERVQERAVVQPSETEGLVSIDYPGGRLADLLAALRKGTKEGNIVAPPVAAQVDVPPFRMQDVDVYTALLAMTKLVNDAGAVFNVSVERFGVADGTNARAAGAAGTQARGVILLRVHELSHRAQTDTVRVFSLRELITPLPNDPPEARLSVSAETVLTAIDVGLSLAGKDQPTIKYHADSALLFVQGGAQHVDVVQQVLSSLRESQMQRRQALSPAEPPHERAKQAPPKAASREAEEPAPAERAK